MLGARQPSAPSGSLIRALSQSAGTDGLTAFSRSTGGTATFVWPAVVPAERGDGRGGAAAEQLEDALDDMHARGEVLMGVYELLGPACRRRGGQGVVQFARRQQNGAEQAIKFFTDRRAFSRELELYKNPTLRVMMPAVSAVQVPPCLGTGRSTAAHADMQAAYPLLSVSTATSAGGGE